MLGLRGLNNIKKPNLKISWAFRLVYNLVRITKVEMDTYHLSLSY